MTAPPRPTWFIEKGHESKAMLEIIHYIEHLEARIAELEADKGIEMLWPEEVE